MELDDCTATLGSRGQDCRHVRKLQHGHALSETRTQIRKLGEYNIQVVSLTHVFNRVSGQLIIPVQVNIQWCL